MLGKKRVSTFFEKLLSTNGNKLNSLIYPTDNVDEVQKDSIGFAGLQNHIYAFDDKTQKITEKIKTYRRMALDPEISSAIDEIVNDAIVVDDQLKPVKINIDESTVSKEIAKKIQNEFESIERMMKLKYKIQDYFYRWYVDGRLFFYLNYDDKNRLSNIFLVDPTKIIKKRRVKIKKDNDNIPLAQEYIDYYEYMIDENKKILLPENNIVSIYSGIKDENNIYISYLDPAIKLWNQLSMLEDAIVIYRISRAPERRIFYIDVGNMPAQKAQQYIRTLMNQFRNKFTYDAKTGQVSGERGVLSMIEDIWLARRADGRGTEIDTLPGGEQLGEIDDLLYFRKKLYRALKIPSTRLDTDNSILQVRATEISREEAKFSRFVQKLRNTFASGLIEILKKQVVSKKIVSESEWNNINISLIFSEDNMFTEQKNAELWNMKFELMNNADNYVGRFISRETFMKKVMNLTHEEYEKEIEKINKEKEEGGNDEEGGRGGYGRRF